MKYTGQTRKILTCIVLIVGFGILRITTDNPTVPTTQLDRDVVLPVIDRRSSNIAPANNNGFPSATCGHWELYSKKRFGETTTMFNPTHPDLREEFDLISVSREAIATDRQGIDVVSTNLQTSENNGLEFALGKSGEPSLSFSGSFSTEKEEFMLSGTLRRLSEGSDRVGIPIELHYRRAPTRKVTVVLVHGTYEGSSSWVNEIPGKVTFASELRRELGSERAHIEPFLWRSANDHSSRVRAAEDLARIIDDSRFSGSPIIVIAFSHGGSVALSAASRCNRRIDQLICLGTPHCSVVAVKDDRDLVMMPVYCPPKSNSNVAQIVNLWARTDTVTRANSPLGAPWASIDTGLTQADAISDTYEWRRRLNYPRLIDDGDVPREILSELSDTPINTCLFAVPWLVNATHNLEIASEKSGIDAHTSMHCTRMGSLLGRILRWRPQLDAAEAAYLSEFVVPGSADTGEAQNWDAIQLKREVQRANMQSGWTLTDLKIEPPTAKNNGDAWDELSQPDLYAVFTAEGLTTRTTTIDHDSAIAEISPVMHFPFGHHNIAIWDKDVFKNDFVGSLTFASQLGASPPSVLQENSITLHMKWRPSHH